jgi:hypothetical protein
MAATLAAGKVGLHMMATDLIESIPDAMKPFDMIT